MRTFLKWWVGLSYTAVATLVHAVILLLLFPSRNLRIRSCNYWGWVTGRFVLWLVGTPVHLTGAEQLDARRPAIYVSNHTSMLDIFLGIWLGPVGTVGVAKKEVIFYPFFGQLYWLSGHLRVDRGDHGKAMQAMADLVDAVKRYRLHIWMWPEGTRSKDGRLLPFKKGIYHLAVQTGLPIVPVVVSGAHKAIPKNTMTVLPVPLTVKVLPAVDTSAWMHREPEAVLGELQAMFQANLPADQQPRAAT